MRDEVKERQNQRERDTHRGVSMVVQCGRDQQLTHCCILPQESLISPINTRALHFTEVLHFWGTGLLNFAAC